MRPDFPMAGRRWRQDAFTLLEVVVVLALIGMILGISTLALASLREPPETATNRLLRAARDSAIRSGVPVTAIVSLSGTGTGHVPRPTLVLFLPDGRAVGTGVDRLTGEPNGPR